MGQHTDEFDLSEYPRDHFLYSETNKKVMGKFKDELNSISLQEFVGSAPKCYSLKFTGCVKGNRIVDADEHEKATAKGTKDRVKNRFLTHEEYRNVVLRKCSVSVKQNTIKSVKHQLGTYHQTRVALTPYDTKRFILDDGITTRAIGHHLNHRVEVLPDIIWGDDLPDDISILEGQDILPGVFWGNDIPVDMELESSLDINNVRMLVEGFED